MPSFDLLPSLEALHERAFGWALVCCARDREWASEVLQASYERVMERRERVTSADALRALLFGAIRNVAREGIARTRRDGDRAHALMHEARSTASTVPSALDDVVRAESERVMRRTLRDAVHALPQRQHEVLHLVFYQELSLREAAAVLDISVGTARQHYARAKGALRDQCAPALRHLLGDLR